MGKISLVGLDKAKVLAALYNASKPQGMGFIHYNAKPMTRDEAAELLKEQTYFDYLVGRVMKVNLEGDELDPWGYDRDNGSGAAAKAIRALRKTGEVNPAEVAASHSKGVLDAASDVEHIGLQTTFEKHEGMEVADLGLDELKAPLEEAVAKATRKHRKNK